MDSVVGSRRLLRASALLLALIGVAPNTGRAAPPEPKPPVTPASPAKPECVKVQAQAPYRGYGYDHIVELRNTCTKPAKCQVATDVNPTPVEQSVPAGETREVLTLRGSPA